MFLLLLLTAFDGCVQTKSYEGDGKDLFTYVKLHKCAFFTPSF